MLQNIWEENEKKSVDSVTIISFGGFKWFKEVLDNPKQPTMYLQEKKIKDLSDFDQSRNHIHIIIMKKKIMTKWQF